MLLPDLPVESETKAKGIVDITVSVTPADAGSSNNLNPLKKGTIGLLPIGAEDRNTPPRRRAIMARGARNEKTNNGTSVTSRVLDRK